MSKEYARVEALVNMLLGKPVAAMVYGILLGSRWTIRQTALLVARLCGHPSTKSSNFQTR